MDDGKVFDKLLPESTNISDGSGKFILILNEKDQQGEHGYKQKDLPGHTAPQSGDVTSSREGSYTGSKKVVNIRASYSGGSSSGNITKLSKQKSMDISHGNVMDTSKQSLDIRIDTPQSSSSSMAKSQMDSNMDILKIPANTDTSKSSKLDTPKIVIMDTSSRTKMDTLIVINKHMDKSSRKGSSSSGSGKKKKRKSASGFGGVNAPKSKSFPDRRVSVSSLTDQITCGICTGYLVDTQTITDCTHSYCRSCIMKHLLVSDSCPECGAKVYKTLPLLNIRPDRQLQDLVYSIVPNLYEGEMLKRREFYKACPPAGFDLTEDQQVSVCLRLCDRYPPYENIKEKDLCVDKRFLLCPASFTVVLMEKFVRLKFNLGQKYKIELFHDNERLYEDYSLLDIALVFGWQRKKPLMINYVVNDTTYIARKRLQMVENKGVMQKSDRRFSSGSNNDNVFMDNPSSSSSQDHSNSYLKLKNKKRKSSSGECSDSKQSSSKDTYNVVVSPVQSPDSSIVQPLVIIKRKRGRPPKRPAAGVIVQQAQRKILKKVHTHSEKVVMIESASGTNDGSNDSDDSNVTDGAAVTVSKTIDSGTGNSTEVQRDNTDDKNTVNAEGSDSVLQSSQTFEKPSVVASQEQSASSSIQEEKIYMMKTASEPIDEGTTDGEKDTNTNMNSCSDGVVNKPQAQVIQPENLSTSTVVSSAFPVTSLPLYAASSNSTISTTLGSHAQTFCSVALQPNQIIMSPKSVTSCINSTNGENNSLQPPPKQEIKTEIINSPQTMQQHQIIASSSNVTHQVPQTMVSWAGGSIHTIPRGTSMLPTISTGSIIKGPVTRVISMSNGQYIVPFPKIKRKRGRPPKNRSLSSFPGRCSPMTFGIPGSPLYALVKRKRGRPPKRKVGLPPVYVVPQQNTVQMSNNPVYVQTVPNNQNVTFVSSQQQQINPNNSGITMQNINQQMASAAQIQQQIVHSTQQQMNVTNSQPLYVQQPQLRQPPHPPQEQKLPDVKEYEENSSSTSLIPHDVVGNIINKLSDEKTSADTPPPIALKVNAHGTVHEFNHTQQQQQTGIPQNLNIPISSAQQAGGGQMYIQNNRPVGNSYQNPVMVIGGQLQSIPSSVNSSYHHHHQAKGQQQVSAFEKQFEKFVHQGKYQRLGGSDVIVVRDNSPSVENNPIVHKSSVVSNHSILSSALSSGINVLSSSLNSQQHLTNSAISSTTTKNISQPSHNVNNINAVILSNQEQSHVSTTSGNPQIEGISSSTVVNVSSSDNSINLQSPTKELTSNPASPESSISEGDQSFSSREGGTTPKRKSWSSLDVKKKKRQNIHNVTEKLLTEKNNKTPKNSNSINSTENVSGQSRMDDNNSTMSQGLLPQHNQISGVWNNNNASTLQAHQQNVGNEIGMCNGTDGSSNVVNGVCEVTQRTSVISSSSNNVNDKKMVYNVSSGNINTRLPLQMDFSGSVTKSYPGREQQPINNSAQGLNSSGSKVTQQEAPIVINNHIAHSRPSHALTSLTRIAQGNISANNIMTSLASQHRINGGFQPPINIKEQQHQLQQHHQELMLNCMNEISSSTSPLKPGSNGSKIRNNSSKNFALLAQKRKQQAAQRLNNNSSTANSKASNTALLQQQQQQQQQSNQQTQGPVYVGVNVFNCPYSIPQPSQGGLNYQSPPAHTQCNKDASNKAMLEDLNKKKFFGGYPGGGNNNGMVTSATMNNSDKPLDFSIKKSK